MFGTIHCYSFKDSEYIEANSYKTFPQSITRITLNNDADQVELIKKDGTLIFRSDEYQDSTKGESYSVFGNTWKWTSKPSPDKQNILAETIEEESGQKSKTKKTSSKTKIADPDKVETKESNSVTEVKSAEVENGADNKSKESTFVVNKQQVGWIMIFSAIIIFIGYFAVTNKEKIYAIFNKE